MADTRDGVELIAGVRRDPRFGPVVMVGLGGLFAEVLDDVAFALAPVDARRRAARCSTRSRGAPLLRGARGRPPVDLAAVARAVAALSAVAAAHPEIAELEVNPLLAARTGAWRSTPAVLARPPTRGADHGLHLHRPAGRAEARAAELRRARSWPSRTACEQDSGLSAGGARDDPRARCSTPGCNAINMPAEWGGAGLSVLEQVVVQEELGKLTGALWDSVWRPANALRACTPEQRERYLLPGIRGERRDAVAITEARRRLGPAAPSRPTATRDGDGYRINGEKWFVTVGDVADYLLVLAKVPPERRADDVPRRQGPARACELLRTPRYMHTFVYEHPEFALRRTSRSGRRRARRGRPGLRPDPRLVHRGAADDRRAHDRRGGARADARRSTGPPTREQGGAPLDRATS